RLLRRLRDGGARQRARQGVVRPLESPPHRGGVQGIRAGAARRLRARRAAGEDAAEHEGAVVIALIDYGAGNLTSVRKALTALGADFSTPATPAELREADGIIVPGVGHFASTANLEDRKSTRLNSSHVAISY